MHISDHIAFFDYVRYLDIKGSLVYIRRRLAPLTDERQTMLRWIFQYRNAIFFVMDRSSISSYLPLIFWEKGFALTFPLTPSLAHAKEIYNNLAVSIPFRSWLGNNLVVYLFSVVYSCISKRHFYFGYKTC